jgi:hypothetical protein
MYIYAYVNTYKNIYVHISICVYTYVCMHMYIYIYVYLYCQFTLNIMSYLKNIACIDTYIGIILPIGQIVNIKKDEFKTGENVVIQGLNKSKKVTLERQLFANGILNLKKNWKFLNTSSILKLKNVAKKRNVNERDSLYIDCSYYSSGDKVTSLDGFLVPIGMYICKFISIYI